MDMYFAKKLALHHLIAKWAIGQVMFIFETAQTDRKTVIVRAAVL